MRKLGLAAAIGCLLSLFANQSGSAQQAPEQEVNLLSFANGALVERASSIYNDSWDPFFLLLEDPQTGWTNAQGIKPPFELVFSLPNRSEIRRVMFDTGAAESPERSAKAISIEVSDDGKTFRSAGSFELKARLNDQQFALPSPASGQFIKLIVKSNYGDDKYWELFNARAFGVPLENKPIPNVTGTYDNAFYGKFHLLQEGAQLTGCYESKGGLVQGGLESHAMRLVWRENTGKQGPAIMVLSRDGKLFKGAWRFDDETNWSKNWDLKKTSSDVGFCPHWKPKTASGNVVAASLADQGRVRLYGINFDIDSDHIRADAKPAIDQLVAALKANVSWKVMIEGHTDATGSDEHNRDLSNRRAASVKAALVAAGIAADHLGSAGFGASKPVASNDNEIGRAQNRRVEVARQ